MFMAEAAASGTSIFGILGGFSIIILLILIALYFLPSVIGFRRNHPNKIPILILNIFLGWSFIGWVIALIWAFKNETMAAPNINIYNNNSTDRQNL